jgi:hypothetical protein
MEGQAAAAAVVMEVPVKLDESEMGEKRREEKRSKEVTAMVTMRENEIHLVVGGRRRRRRGDGGDGEGEAKARGRWHTGEVCERAREETRRR